MSKCFPAYPRKRPHTASLDLGVIATAQPGRAWPLVRVRSMSDQPSVPERRGRWECLKTDHGNQILVFPAITYLWNAGPVAFAVIGGAFLAVTGGEALYADMGHFGRLPIRVAWFGCALPALTLNYFGQGGLLLIEPGAVESPFYQLAPQWSHYGLVVLATLATVIASQAIITGAYSLTQQAIQLGFLPRMNVIHTAGHERGQIYIPFVNWTLAIATLVAVIGFGSSDALGGAYGIAVSLLMAITTLMATFVALHWKHNRLIVYTVNSGLLAVDLAFFASMHQVRRRRLVPCADCSCYCVHHAHLAQGRGDDGHDSP